MVTPREEKEMVLKYENKDAFRQAFFDKYITKYEPIKMIGRINSLWNCRAKHAIELAELKSKEVIDALERDAKNYEKNHTVMIPARIVSKHTPSRDTVPDVGEILIRTNHLLAEMVQLQKEQIALFKEIQGGKK